MFVLFQTGESEFQFGALLIELSPYGSMHYNQSEVLRAIHQFGYETWDR